LAWKHSVRPLPLANAACFYHMITFCYSRYYSGIWYSGFLYHWPKCGWLPRHWIARIRAVWGTAELRRDRYRWQALFKVKKCIFTTCVSYLTQNGWCVSRITDPSLCLIYFLSGSWPGLGEWCQSNCGM
jgi:hypothetical protein